LTFTLALTDFAIDCPIEDTTAQQDDKFMVMVSINHGETWDVVSEWNNTTGAEHVYNQIPYDGEEVQISLANYMGQTVRIAFYGESTASGGDNDLHIDDVRVGEMPACSAPSHLVWTDFGDVSATLTWTENGDATSWQVEYGPAGFTSGSGTVLSVSDTPSVTLTGLVESTSYDVYVRANCGSNSYSNPAFKTFTTSCAPITLPFTEDFDAVVPGLYAPFLSCWHRFNSFSALSYPYISDTYSHSGAQSLYFYNSSSTYSMAVLPMVDPVTNPVNTLKISFYMRANHNTSQMIVGVLSDPMNYGTFVPVDTISIPGNGVFSLQEVPLDSYTGNGRYVALCMRNTTSMYPIYVDDVTLEIIPTCLKPVNVSALNVAATTATLWWIENNTTSSWNIRVNDGTTEDTVSVGENPYTLTGLTPETSYTVWVQTNCGDGDLSTWSDPFTFTTLTATDPTVTTLPALPVGQYSATLNGTVTNPDNVTIMAQGFEWKATADDAYTQVAATGNTMSYSLTGLTANTGYTYKAFITFDGTTVYGDEETFTTLPEDTPDPCDVPTNLHTTSVENESISIAWDANADVSSWNIQYRPQGGTYVSATSTTNSYTITGLTGLTTYEIQVQAVCADGQVSDWCTAITAMTTNVGVEEHLMNSIVLFPNPAKEVVNVQCTMYNAQWSGADVEVFDVYGKLLQTVRMSSETTQINISGMADGMYFVRVTTDQGVVTKTFVKH